jgi:hypothetical protein
VRFLVDKVELRQVFSEYFGVPLSVFIPPIAPQLPPSIIWGWDNGPVVAAVPSGLSLTPLQKTKKIYVTFDVILDVISDIHSLMELSPT